MPLSPRDAAATLKRAAELRPLPIRALEAALVYASIGASGAPSGEAS